MWQGWSFYNTATTGDVLPGFYCNDGTKWVSGFVPSGNAVGDMLYWDGSSWVNIPVGTSGQFLQLNNMGIPVWMGAAYANITTNAATIITGISATSGGNIISDGGCTILNRGICYSTSPNPTTANTVKVASPAIGNGSFMAL